MENEEQTIPCKNNILAYCRGGGNKTLNQCLNCALSGIQQSAFTNDTTHVISYLHTLINALTNHKLLTPKPTQPQQHDPSLS